MMNFRASIDLGANIPLGLIEETKKEAACSGIDLLYIPSKAFSPNDFPPELIIVLLEVLKNISYSGIYDAVKFFVIYFKLKVENFYGSKVKKITFVCNGEKYSVSTNFELSQENIDKIIDSIANKILRD